MAVIPSRVDPQRPQFSRLVGPVETYFLNTIAGNGSTASTTFVDYPGPLDKVFIKRETATALFISGFAGGFATGGTLNMSIGLRINGVDYLIGRFFFNDVNSHRIIAYNVPIAAGLLAGQYTARLRWFVSGNTGNANGDDVVHLRIEEGYFA